MKVGRPLYMSKLNVAISDGSHSGNTAEGGV
jgi:hypothetical protein